MIDYEELAEAMGDLDEDTVKELLETVMADGGSGAQQAMDACQKGMDIVGSRFESGEYFVGDLIYAGELMTDAVSILKDALVTGDGGGTKTKMILCTVKDDLHDIGKNIVRSMLEAAGFEVLDLGIDVPASEIVKAAKENSIKIVALSGVLTLAIDSMKATVEAFKADGMDACQKGMDIVGSRFESGEYFVGDLIYAGELMTDAVSILKDALVTGDGGGTKTKMILCTVKDDLHDIGKNIVRSMLEAAGFEVLDLGIDVPASEIVKAAKENSIKIVALSGVLTLAIDSMKATVEAFKADGMDDVKIIIGGAPVSEEAMKITGADEWAHSPQKTVQVCKDWAEAI